MDSTTEDPVVVLGIPTIAKELYRIRRSARIAVFESSDASGTRIELILYRGALCLIRRNACSLLLSIPAQWSREDDALRLVICGETVMYHLDNGQADCPSGSSIISWSAESGSSVLDNVDLALVSGAVPR